MIDGEGAGDAGGIVGAARHRLQVLQRARRELRGVVRSCPGTVHEDGAQQRMPFRHGVRGVDQAVGVERRRVKQEPAPRLSPAQQLAGVFAGEVGALHPGQRPGLRPLVRVGGFPGRRVGGGGFVGGRRRCGGTSPARDRGITAAPAPASASAQQFQELTEGRPVEHVHRP